MSKELPTSYSLETATPEQHGSSEIISKKAPWWRHLLQRPGPAMQIIIAAVLAIAIGLTVSSTVEEVPTAAITLVRLPGDCWLRALKCVVLPLIITSMILAVQQLKEMSGSGQRIAKWTIGYYLLTTIVAIVNSTLAVSLGWRRLMTTVGADTTVTGPPADREDVAPHDIAVDLFEQLVPANVVDALATDALLSVLVMAVVVGCLLKPGSPLLAAVREVEQLVTTVISFLIRVAPVGVFFLVMANLFRLDIAEIGQNLGVLIGAALAGMFIHLFLLLPLLFVVITRENPYLFFARIAPAWMTAWGTASSAATLPVTMKSTLAQGVPLVVTKFVVSVGCMVNMDGTAIYFPVVVTFMAATQGIVLNAGEYVIVVLLSTLATIGASPIPSSSLVLTVMICESINVPITGMYAVVVAIDWFLDRFRTMVNVCGDSFAAKIVASLTGIKDPEESGDGIVEEGRGSSGSNA